MRFLHVFDLDVSGDVLGLLMVLLALAAALAAVAVGVRGVLRAPRERHA